MIYRLKLSDIVLSLFVEFCIVLTLASVASILVLPYFPREEITAIVGVLILWTITIPALILTGAGLTRGLNRFSLFVMIILGWFFFAAGWLDYFGSDLMSLSFVITFFLLIIGREIAYSKWIDKLVIIKRNPEFEEEPEQPTSNQEPLEELFD